MITFSREYPIVNIIDGVKKGTVILPEFQRDYKWNEDDIISIFESILKDYPIGSFIFWECTGNRLQDDLTEVCGFIDEVKRNKKSYKEKHRIPVSPSGKRKYTIVLDGQQRITSLFLAISGKITTSGKEKKLLLSYNLNYDANSDELCRKFVFCNEQPGYSINDYIEDGFFPVCDIISLTDRRFFESILSFKREVQSELRNIRYKFKDKTRGFKINAFVLAECDYEEALNVFTIVNSTGKKLTKTDLLLSRLVGNAENSKHIKNELKEIVKEINRYSREENRFCFDIDFILHSGLVILGETASDRKLNISNIGKQSAKILRNKNKLTNALKRAKVALVQIGFCDSCITSYNSIIPVVYYYYKSAVRNSDKDNENIKQFLMRTNMLKTFGSGTDEVLNKCVLAVDKMIENTSNVHFDWTVFEPYGVNLNVTVNDIEAWLELKKGPKARNLLYYLRFNTTPYANGLEQDHLHPKKMFENLPDNYYVNENTILKMEDEDAKRWTDIKDMLPNLDMLVKERNVEKLKTPLKDWVEKHNYYIEYRPDNISLAFDHFEMFFKARKEILKSKLMELFCLIDNEQCAGKQNKKRKK